MLLQSKDNSPPILLVALDVVIQRAVYELSDKVFKDWDTNDSLSQINESLIQYIEDCISIMNNHAIPLCLAGQAALGLSYFMDNNGNNTTIVGNKMATLCRQLQEFLSWTTLKGQNRIPNLFPSSSSSSSSKVSTLYTTTNNTSSSSSLFVIGEYSPQITPSLSQQQQHALNPHVMNMINLADQTFSSIIQESYVNFTNDIIENIMSKMMKIIAVQMTPQSIIQPCGSALFHPCFADEQFSLDFAITSYADAGILNADAEILLSTYREVEKALELDLYSDAALKHLKACVKDSQNATMELMKLCASHTSSNEFTLYMQREHELVQSHGSRMIDTFAKCKANRQSRFVLLTALVSKYELIQEQLDRSERDRIILLRKFAKILEKSFREYGFHDVKNENSRARFVNLKMISFDVSTRQSYPLTLILESQLPILSTNMIMDYLFLDETGKLRLYLDIIKKFTKSHGIADVMKGFLSPFAWTVLALHVLLRDNMIPTMETVAACKLGATNTNTHATNTASNHNNSNNNDSDTHESLLNSLSSPLDSNNSNNSNNNNTTSNSNNNIKNMDELRYITTEKLRMISVIELLDRFFRYYVISFDFLSAIVTLRNQGEIIVKSKWHKTAVLWRLSIEVS
jgi:hypothetical protein